MKKIVSTVLTVVLIFGVCAAAAVSAGAAEKYGSLVLSEHESFTLEKDTAYRGLRIADTSTLTVKDDKTLSLSDGGSMTLDGGMVRLESNALWTGSDVALGETPAALIRMDDGAKIDISFAFENHAIAFYGLLIGNKIECARDGNRIFAPCTHENVDQRTVCLDCGHAFPEDTPTEASMLSGGYPEVIFGVGGIAVGFIAAMIIFKKKKPAKKADE